MMRLKELGLVLAMVFGCFHLLAQAPETKAGEQSEPASFQVRNKKFRDLLRPEDANSANGTRIVLYSAQTWKCLTWKMLPAGESAFSLQNHFTSKTFAVDAKSGSRSVVQVPFAIDASQRPVWKVTKLNDGAHKILDARSGEALTAVKGSDGTVTIVAAAWADKDEQKWELIKMDPRQLSM